MSLGPRVGTFTVSTHYAYLHNQNIYTQIETNYNNRLLGVQKNRVVNFIKEISIFFQLASWALLLKRHTIVPAVAGTHGKGMIKLEPINMSFQKTRINSI